MTKLESLIESIRSHRSPPENYYNDGFNQGLEVAITEVVRSLQDEPPAPPTSAHECVECGFMKVDADEYRAFVLRDFKATTEVGPGTPVEISAVGMCSCGAPATTCNECCSLLHSEY